MTDPAPTGLMPRAADDRRHEARRAEEQRLHLARELVLSKAKDVADSYGSPLGLDITGLEQMAELVEVLRSAEQAVAARQPTRT